MFIGEYSHNLDEKGRISVPAKFRKQLAEGIVITRGLDHCLFVYPRREWQEIAEKLANLPLSQRKSRAFARLMLAGAWDAVPDTQGRVMIPDYLREYATIAKRVVITGLYNRLEMWDEEVWQKYKHQTEEESDAIAESLTGLGV
jgi:MraZ protein